MILAHVEKDVVCINDIKYTRRVFWYTEKEEICPWEFTLPVTKFYDCNDEEIEDETIIEEIKAELCSCWPLQKKDAEMVCLRDGTTTDSDGNPVTVKWFVDFDTTTSPSTPLYSLFSDPTTYVTGYEVVDCPSWEQRDKVGYCRKVLVAGTWYAVGDEVLLIVYTVEGDNVAPVESYELWYNLTQWAYFVPASRADFWPCEDVKLIDIKYVPMKDIICPPTTWPEVCDYTLGPWKYSFDSFSIDGTVYDAIADMWLMASVEPWNFASFEDWASTTFPWTTFTMTPEWGGIGTLVVNSPNVWNWWNDVGSNEGNVPFTQSNCVAWPSTWPADACECEEVCYMQAFELYDDGSTNYLGDFIWDQGAVGYAPYVVQWNPVLEHCWTQKVKVVNCPGKLISSETIQWSSPALSAPAEAKYAIAQVLEWTVIFTVDGSTTPVEWSVWYHESCKFTLESKEEIQNFQAIGSSQYPPVIHITYYNDVVDTGGF